MQDGGAGEGAQASFHGAASPTRATSLYEDDFLRDEESHLKGMLSLSLLAT